MLVKFTRRNYTEKMAKELSQCSEEYMKVVRRMPAKGLPITRANVRRFAQVGTIEPWDIYCYFLKNIGTYAEQTRLYQMEREHADAFAIKFEGTDHAWMGLNEHTHEQDNRGAKIVLRRAQRALIEEALEILKMPECDAVTVEKAA